ncbi:beta-ketoacyl synthase N-terminal-like domain-containing protein [Rouxiella sp. Mn2063]|uniref:beta-ketoacyl synthase N-terminal-like domain-containing protein n=1 Tax=Rouxiella sp. Mn2063 TaxID=3395262 RepID=UPI003BE0CE87
MQQIPRHDQAIALVGMSCRFPGASDIDSWWHNLINGVESLVQLDSDTDGHSDDHYVPVAAPLLADITHFDADFFGLSVREALLMEPQQRLFLECAWHALESAGVVPGDLPDAGIFAGCSSSNYLRQAEQSALFQQLAPSPFEQQIASDKDYLTSRVAWHLGIGGPVLNVQAACATSLVAVYEAVQALRNGKCSMAMAGACTLRIPQRSGYVAQQGMVFANDGHCRPFSADASGTVFGSGVAVVVMKRLQDALKDGNDIIAVIEGAAMNNDGANKVSFTTTSLQGQQRLLRQAMEDAQLSPNAFRAIEAHGTGTQAGDPIEFEALSSVFAEQTSEQHFCAIGAVKANVGHLETCAGMAGLIKAALQIKHGWLTPQINFSAPNPALSLANSPFEFLNSAQRWEDNDPRTAIGVSAFGIGGTNAHVILTRPPQKPQLVQQDVSRSLLASVVPVSAQSEQAWHRLVKHYLQRAPSSNGFDMVWRAQIERKSFRYRGTLHRDGLGGLSVKESAIDIGKGRLSIVFQFPGQGSQFIGMASELMQQDAVFQKIMANKLAILKRYADVDISTLFNGEASPELINNTAITQPALIAVEIGVAELLMHYGIRPDWVMGHSLGEIAAAWAFGAFSTKDALVFAAQRGRMMASLQPGMMLAVELSAEQCQQWLSEDISLAAVNSENSCVLSGSEAVISACESQLRCQHIRCKALNVSHAFHSALMDPILTELASVAPQAGTTIPSVRYLSALLGAEITQVQQLDAEYWRRHAREPVHYHQALEQLPVREKMLFIEVGPGSTLTALVAQLRQKSRKTTAVRTMRRHDDAQSESALWSQAIQKIWRAGVNIHWANLWSSPIKSAFPPHDEALPLYPFEPKQWWLGKQDLFPTLSNNPSPSSPAINRPDPLTERISLIWAGVIGAYPESNYSDFFDVGGQSLMALRLLALIEREFSFVISMADFLQRPTPAGIKECLEQAGVVEQVFN